MAFDPQTLETTQTHLFSSPVEMTAAGLPAHAQDRILRLREVYLYCVNNPLAPDRVVMDVIQERWHLSHARALGDLQLIKALIGNVNQTTREYLRWKFLQHIEEGLEMARKSEDPNAYAKMLASFVKGTGLDKSDVSRVDYSQITPEALDFTTNPEVVGAKRIPKLDQKISKMLKRYAIDTDAIDLPATSDT